MANILSLAMKINADASGFKLDPVQRALQGLAAEADKVGKVFDEFAGTSEAAARAQAKTAAELERLTQARLAGTITAKEFAEQFVAVTEEANKEAAALRRAAQITEQNLTPLERYDATLAELQSQLDAGRISQETFTRANERAAKGLSDAERAARGFDAAVESTADNASKTTLQFNELSGVFAVLPGPLGNIAGRISGIASAGEGLSRVFSGGLTQGISGVGRAVAGLINPFTVSAGAIAAFGAAAVQIAQGLLVLEDRVENLGNTADKLGLSFEFVQVLDEAARRSGTSIDAVSSAFGRLQKSVLGVDEESKTAQKALAEIGVTAEEIQKLNPQEQYQLIGRRISEIEDPARRTATAINLFGKAGADLLPFFRNIDGAATDLERVGAALSDRQRRDIDEFGAAMDRLSVASRGAGEQIQASFAPAGEAIANALAKASGAVAKFIEDQNDAASFSREFAELQRGLINRRATDSERALIESGRTAEEVLRRVAAQAAILRDTGEFVNLTDSLVDAALAGKEAAAGIGQAASAADEIALLSSKGQDLLDKAIAKTGELGQAGLAVTLRYQESLRDIDALVQETSYTEEQAARARQNATADYEQQIDIVRLSVEERRKAADEAARLAEAEADAVQKIIDAYLEQIRIDEQFGGDSNRAVSADNLTKLLAEQVRVEEQLAAARASGDQSAIDAATRRLAQIDQVAARERDIASGAAKARDEAEKAAAKAADDAQRRAEQQAKAIDRINGQIFDKQQEFFSERFEIELERARELATVRSGSIEIQDIREGGISAFFDTLREDPAIAEAKRQTKELESIRKELAKLQAEKVDILAGNG